MTQAIASTGTAAVSGFNSTTAGLIFGLGFENVTGTPTITVPLVEAQAKNLY